MPNAHRATTLLLATLALLPASAHGQDGSTVTSPVQSITEADVRRRVFIIAHDSMGGRNTPSIGLEKTAAYVASEFRRFGLQPAGDGGSYLQRYLLDRVKLDGDASLLDVSRGGKHVVARASRDMLYVMGRRTEAPVAGRPLVLAGRLDSSAVSGLKVEGRLVVVAWEKPTGSLVGRNRFLAALLERRPAGVVLLQEGDGAAFAKRIAEQRHERVAFGVGGRGGPPVVAVPARLVRPMLDAAGLPRGSSSSTSRLVAREVPGVEARLVVRDAPGTAPTAPNVVGILPGSDPALRDEYVIFSAHMDHVGTNRAAGTDTIWNGADDDASGTAGVLELAEAFAMRGARPRRSLIFLTVSGEEKGLWGSAYFAANMPVPASRVVADLNIDMIGRNWRDTIVAIGKEHSDLGATLDRVAREHPELRMKAIDDLWPEENFYSRSDHYNFARLGIPILFFFNGTHADYHQPSDSPDKIDAEKEARIVRLLFHLGSAVANAPERPRWNPESLRAIVP